MTFAATYDPVVYAGNGISTRFSTLWPFADTTHVRVEEIDADGVATPLVFGTDYTVEETDERRGTIVATTAPASTVSWRITRRTPLLVGRDDVPAAGPAVLTFVAVGERGNILRSIDRGATWEGVSPPAILGEWVSFTDVAGNGNTWIAVTEGGSGIWRSTDRAATWTQVAGINNNTNFTSIVCVDSNVFVAFIGAWIAGDNAGLDVLRTADGGATWTLIPHGIALDTFSAGNFIDAAIGNGVIYAMSFSGGFSPAGRSADGGLTWAPIIRDPEGWADPYYVSYANGLFLATANDTVYHSTTALDGSWTLIQVALGESAGQSGRFVWLGDTYFTFDYAGFGPMKTTDLTAYTYDAIANNGTDPVDIATDGITIVWCGDSYSPTRTGIYRTTSSIAVTTCAIPVGYDWNYDAVFCG